MADRAQVTSVDAIESFRASLILFLSKVRPTLEEVSSEVVRMRAWLQSDRYRRWEHELKLRGRNLEEAQEALFSAMMSKMREATAEQQRNVRHAKQALAEAETKLRLVKKWERELDHQSEPLVKLVEQMHGFLTSEMTKAVALLSRSVKSLDAYAAAGPTDTSPAPLAAADAATDEGAPPAAGAETETPNPDGGRA